MRLAWLTDIHLNFLDDIGRAQFWQAVRPRADAVVITGDIAESPTLASHLADAERSLEMPIYFVLGNHDFYRGSIAQTRAGIAEVARQSQYLVYLSASGAVELTANTALVGHDGWADARLGDFDRSEIVLNDYLLIEELANCWKLGLDKGALREALHALGDEAAGRIAGVLGEASARYPRVVLATHVPPFREAAWHEGHASTDEWLPHFASKAMGDTLLAAAEARPECEILVLCGHTHSGGEIQVRENLRVLTGKARYRHPAVEQVLELD